MRKALTYLLLLSMLLGMSSFVFNMLLSFGILKFEGELPITDIQDVQEQNDKIYIGLGVYNRIQMYDLEGKYLNSINTNNFGKAYDFFVDDDGNPSIHVIYSRKGFLKTFPQGDGARYRKVSQFPLQINKIDDKGERMIIQQPLHMSLWGGTFRSWLIAAVCAILFLLINSIILMEVFGSNSPKNEKVKLAFRKIFL